MEKLKDFLDEGMNRLPVDTKRKVKELFTSTDDVRTKLAIVSPYLVNEGVYSVGEIYDEMLAYQKRNVNYYVASMPPRRFGETEIQKMVVDSIPGAEEANKEFPYDFVSKHGKKYEVKGTRARRKLQDKDNMIPLSEKMARYGECTDPFNFQQVKVGDTDFFVFTVVYLDDIKCIVLGKEEVSPMVKRQHRGGDGSEGQVTIKPEWFNERAISLSELKNVV